MDDEPLEQWARRREERQARNKGRLRQVPLWGGPQPATWDRPAAAKPRGRHRRPARGNF
ncbi:DUF6087 family protein [Streptomyces sp. NPDC093707]|uniref:DUF6087 family protein n=1 Tax=Streptomyces sp. NPDC093707 TaxID=3154984 RepID=UPI00344F353D